MQVDCHLWPHTHTRNQRIWNRFLVVVPYVVSQLDSDWKRTFLMLFESIWNIQVNPVKVGLDVCDMVGNDFAVMNYSHRVLQLETKHFQAKILWF